ncbi:hypothetical protein C1645_35777 [Glomus cerebriforme]|uniref:Uncharacterized protein n=1 Tax=Glomus cerebriforme TaxID=658196 RepID=A0A397T6N8_9GLOM|nr:hypothetical protein C1645_35777 [Glomus cerebriforme]
MAFRSLTKNLLLQRYPLIFSPNYQEKLQSITKHISTISKSIARIINDSPNDEFRSKANKLVQKTRNRVNLSFSLHQDIKEESDLTSKQIRNILENGLYTIARDINVHVAPYVEHSSSDEEIIDNRAEARDAAKSQNDVSEAGFDVSYQTKDTNPMHLDYALESEDNELLFDTDDDLLVNEDDVESTFENEHEDNQNLIEEEFEYSSSSENYENFWDEEDIQFLLGIKDDPTETTSMNICNDYITEFSKKYSLDNVDLLDFGTLDEDMHDYSNVNDLEGSSSFTKRYDSNNLTHSQPRSPFRDKMNTLFQGQENYDSISSQKLQWFQDSEDTFFDTMF